MSAPPPDTSLSPLDQENDTERFEDREKVAALREGLQRVIDIIDNEIMNSGPVNL